MSRSFDGNVANALDVGDVAAVDIVGTALTIAFFQRWTGAGTHLPLTKSGTAAASVQYSFDTASSKANFAIGDATDQDKVTGATTLTGSVWQHVCGVKNGTGADALKIYLNGVEDGSITSNRTIQNRAESLFIGKRSDIGFVGQLSHAAIWDIALSPGEVAALAKGVSPRFIRPQNLKGFWPLYGTGSPERDYSGQGSHATINGTVPAGATNPSAMPFVFPGTAGEFGAGPAIDEATIYIDIQPSSVDVAETVDQATVLVDLQTSGVDIKEITDAATVYVDITNTGGECFSGFSGQFFGEGEANARWRTSAHQTRWSTDEIQERWVLGALSTESGC